MYNYENRIDWDYLNKLVTENRLKAVEYLVECNYCDEDSAFQLVYADVVDYSDCYDEEY